MRNEYRFWVCDCCVAVPVVCLVGLFDMAKISGYYCKVRLTEILINIIGWNVMSAADSLIDLRPIVSVKRVGETGLPLHRPVQQVINGCSKDQAFIDRALSKFIEPQKGKWGITWRR